MEFLLWLIRLDIDIDTVTDEAPRVHDFWFVASWVQLKRKLQVRPGLPAIGVQMGRFELQGSTRC